MRIDKRKVDLILARSCKTINEIQENSDMPLPTIKAAYSGRNVKPVTAGKLARALGVDVEEILESDGKDTKKNKHNNFAESVFAQSETY